MLRFGVPFNAVLLATSLVASQAPALSAAQSGAQGTAQSAAPPVVGRVLDSDAHAPVAGATVVALDTALAIVARTRTDSAGAFVFRSLSPQPHVFQAHLAGRAGAPTAPLFGDALANVLTLVLPSELFALGSYCHGGPRESALVGIVYEGGGDVALPGARVIVRWSDADSLVATTDGAGRYRFCGVPMRSVVDVRMEAVGRRQRLSIEVPAGRVARADLAFDLGAGASSLLVRGETQIDSRTGAGILSGRVIDAATQQPIDQAVVRLHGREEPAFTTPGGDFRFIGVAPGEHVIEIEHLAYGTQREGITLAAATALDVELRLTPQAILLDAIEARGEAQMREAWLASSSPAKIVAGRDLAFEEARSGRVADLVKTRFPSLKVSEGMFFTRDGITRGVCMESIRRIMSVQPGDTPPNIPFCDTIEVIVDGVAVTDPVGFLGSVSLGDFESVSFMSDIDAGIRYGRDAGAHGGVLILHTRGRGPYVSQERNIPPAM